MSLRRYHSTDTYCIPALLLRGDSNPDVWSICTVSFITRLNEWTRLQFCIPRIIYSFLFIWHAPISTGSFYEISLFSYCYCWLSYWRRNDKFADSGKNLSFAFDCEPSRSVKNIVVLLYYSSTRIPRLHFSFVIYFNNKVKNSFSFFFILFLSFSLSQFVQVSLSLFLFFLLLYPIFPRMGKMN